MYRMVHNSCLNKVKKSQMQSEHHEQMVYASVLSGNDVEYSLFHKELSYNLARYFSGEISEKENQILDDWLAQSAENEKEFQKNINPINQTK